MAIPADVGKWSDPLPFKIKNRKLVDPDNKKLTVTDDRGLFVLHAVVLKTGKVLCFGGHVEVAYYPATSYVFDPAKPTATMKALDFPAGMDLFCCHYVQIPDGRILVIGGSDKGFSHHGNSIGAKNVAIFDPDENKGAGKWSQVKVGGTPVELLQSRWYPTPVLLPDGRVFIVSGRPDHVGAIADKAEILTGPTWQSTELVTAQKALPIYPGLHLAPDGKIYFTHATWGQEITGPPTMAIDPTVANAAWTEFAGNFPKQWRREEGMSVLLPPAQDGKILVVGGTRAENAAGVPIMNGGTPAGQTAAEAFRKIHDPADPFSAEIMDTTKNPPQWSDAPGGPMKFGRTNGHCVILPDATVFICGGHDFYKWQASWQSPPTNPSLDAEIFTPNVGFTTMAKAERPRMYHSIAVLLPDGRVMTAGGADPDQPEPKLEWPDGWNPQRRYDGPYPLNDKTFEFYEPTYFFNGARPKIDDIVVNGTKKVRRIEYGTNFKILTKQAASIDRVAIMRPCAPTHHTDSEQRYVRLDFTKGTNELNVTMVNDARLAPPGFYMLWIVATGGKNGLPCEKAVFIHIPVRPTPTPAPAPPATHPPAPPPPAEPPPNPNPQSQDDDSWCFVATATLGSARHPSVLYLRALRGEIVAASPLGRTFIRVVNRVYYSFSPRLARWLARHPIPRRAVRDAVVRPVVAVISATDRITRPLPAPQRNAARVALLGIEGLLGIAALPLVALAAGVRAAIEALLGERNG